MIVSQHFDMFLLVYSDTTLTGESQFHISNPLRFEPRSLITGSKRVDHWTSGTVYECSEIAGSPQVYDCPYLVISISFVFMIKLMSHIIHRPHAPNDGGGIHQKADITPLPRARIARCKSETYVRLGYSEKFIFFRVETKLLQIFHVYEVMYSR